MSVFLLFFGSQVIFADELVKEEDKLTNYHLEVHVNDQEKELTTKQTVKFSNNYSHALNELVFHLYADSYNQIETIPSIGGYGENQALTDTQIGDIKITAVQVNQQEVDYTDNEQLLKINLANPLEANEEVEIQIEFTLKIPEGRHRLGYFRDVISLTNWYPILSIYNEESKEWDLNPYHPIGESNYSDVADYQLEIHLPMEMKLASTGIIIDEKEGDSLTTTTNGKIVSIEADKVRDFVMILSNNYKVLSKEVDGIKVNSFYLTENKETATILLNEVVDTIQFMNQKVGNYPYKELDIVETYLAGGAMEYPQLLQMGSFYPIEPNYKESNRAPFLLEAAIHETIHQWWYVAVGNNEYLEPLLDESLTVFTTAYYFEKEYGQYHNNGIIVGLRNRVYPEKTLPYNSTVAEFSNWGEYGNVIYGRAPIIFEDLRYQVGEQKFLEILQKYYQTFVFKNASIQDFLDIVKEVTNSKVNDYLTKAISDSNYFPEHLQLTEEEFKIMRREMFKSELKERNVGDLLNIGSFLLKALEDEKVYLIKPKVKTEQAQNSINQLIEGLKMEFSGNMGVDLIVVEEPEITSDVLKKNYIVLGNPQNNQIIANLNDEMPMYLTSKGVILDDLFLKTTDYNGYFVAENPLDHQQLILSIFWSNDEKLPSHYNFMWENQFQFFLQINGKMEMKGQF